MAAWDMKKAYFTHTHTRTHTEHINYHACGPPDAAIDFNPAQSATDADGL